MDLPKIITLPTGEGDARASPEGPDLWRLTTPWDEERFCGDRTAAFRRLRERVWAAECDPKHNTRHRAVEEAIRFLSQPSSAPAPSRKEGDLPA